LCWGAALAATLAALGCRGADGEQGVQGPPGNGGDVPPLKNDVVGTVTDGAEPLSGVTVTAFPGSATATSDGKGALSIAGLAIGAYEMTFHLAGYVDRTVPVAVSLAAPTKVAVTSDLRGRADPESDRRRAGRVAHGGFGCGSSGEGEGAHRLRASARGRQSRGGALFVPPGRALRGTRGALDGPAMSLHYLIDTNILVYTEASEPHCTAHA
jgi:hypothetical protein